MKWLFVFILLLKLSDSYAASAGVKNEDGSFKLPEQSLKILGIKFSKLDSSGPWKILKSSLVNIKFTKGVYRRYEGYIAYVIVNVLKDLGNEVLIASSDLERGDEIAIEGTTYLRLTEADLNSDTVDACTH